MAPKRAMSTVPSAFLAARQASRRWSGLETSLLPPANTAARSPPSSLDVLPASRNANVAAAKANWSPRVISRAVRGLIAKSSSGNSWISAPTRLPKEEASKAVTGPIAESPRSRRDQVNSVPAPSAETMPTPVTATRFIPGTG